MGFKSKIATIAITFTILQYVKAKATPVTIPNTVYGCPPINHLIECDPVTKCETDTNLPCAGTEICCPHECGSTCRVPDYIEPSPIRGCPAIDTRITCIHFNEVCNQKDKLCPKGSICCGNNCGTFCVDTKRKNQPNPVRGCPAIPTGIVCVWFYEQCNAEDKLCPAGYKCCGYNCGTHCIKRNGTVLDAVLELLKQLLLLINQLLAVILK